MRLDSRRLATLALPLAFVSASPVMAAPVSPETENLVRQYRAELRGHVKHIVIVIQENRSVDNLFNGLPGADTVRFGHSHSGLVAMHPVDLSFPADVDHQHRAFLTEFNDGRMDGWDRARSYPPQGPDFPYAYVPREQVEPYWDMAERYTFADRMFQSNTGPSFPAHLYLVAGESANTASNPNHLETTQFAWGCDSPPGATVTVLDKRGDERPGPFPCLEFNTLADLADAAHVSWRYYAPPLESLGSIWSAFDAIRHIRYGPQWSNVISPETRVLTDARSGEFGPPVSAQTLERRRRRARTIRAGLGRLDRQRDRQRTPLGQHRRARGVGRLGRVVRSRRTAQGRPHGARLSRPIHRDFTVRAAPLRLARATRVRQHLKVRRADLQPAVAEHDRPPLRRATRLLRFLATARAVSADSSAASGGVLYAARSARRRAGLGRLRRSASEATPSALVVENRGAGF
jgi:hypothetical protein